MRFYLKRWFALACLIMECVYAHLIAQFLALLFQTQCYLFRASAAVSRSERMADQRCSPRVLTAVLWADRQACWDSLIFFRPLSVIDSSTRPPARHQWPAPNHPAAMGGDSAQASFGPSPANRLIPPCSNFPWHSMPPKSISAWGECRAAASLHQKIGSRPVSPNAS